MATPEEDAGAAEEEEEEAEVGAGLELAEDGSEVSTEPSGLLMV